MTPSRMFHVDPADPTPLQAQLASSIRSAITAGVLGADEVLPTVRQLAVELRLNANLVERAYEELEGEGLLETRAGVGRVVRPSPDVLHPSDLLSALCALEDAFLSEAAALGFSRDEVIIHLDSRRS